MQRMHHRAVVAAFTAGMRLQRYAASQASLQLSASSQSPGDKATQGRSAPDPQEEEDTPSPTATNNDSTPSDNATPEALASQTSESSSPQLRSSNHDQVTLGQLLRRVEILERQISAQSAQSRGGPSSGGSSFQAAATQQRVRPWESGTLKGDESAGSNKQQQQQDGPAEQQQAAAGANERQEGSGVGPQQRSGQQQGPQQGQQQGRQGVGEAVTEEAEEALRSLHPSIAKLLSSGYLESQAQLRDQLMQHEWGGTVRPWMLRKGVSEFEKFAAEKDLKVPYEAISRLYQNPNDLEALADERHRQLARAMIAAVESEKQLEVYKSCSETAKSLANVMESSQSTGIAAVWVAVRRLLPS